MLTRRKCGALTILFLERFTPPFSASPHSPRVASHLMRGHLTRRIDTRIARPVEIERTAIPTPERRFARRRRRIARPERVRRRRRARRSSGVGRICRLRLGRGPAAVPSRPPVALHAHAAQIVLAVRILLLLLLLRRLHRQRAFHDAAPRLSTVLAKTCVQSMYACQGTMR